MRTVSSFWSNLRRGLTQPDERVRAWSFVTGAILLVLFLGLSLATPLGSWFNNNAVATTLLITGLLLAVGGAAFYIDDAARKRQLDSVASAAGFAAVVDQLSELDRALTLWLDCPSCLQQAKAAGIDREAAAGHGVRPFKWGKALRDPNLSYDPYGSHDASMEHRAPPSLAPAVDSVTLLNEVCNEALRRLMASLRSWIGLLSRTDSGLEAIGSLNRLRMALAILSDIDDRTLVVQTRDRAHVLAMVFERAGGVRSSRTYVPLEDVTLHGIEPGMKLEIRLDPDLDTEESARATLGRLAQFDDDWPRTPAIKQDYDQQRLYSRRVGDALAYAAELHANQSRKGKNEPYLSHLLMVTSMVMHYGGTEDQIIAAVLHDAAEDQGGEDTARAIGRRFGSTVEELVRQCSDSLRVREQTKDPWRVRKEAYLRRTRLRGYTEATLVEVCDKVANLTDIVEDLQRDGTDTLRRFSGGPEGVLWYYRQIRVDLISLVPHANRRYDELLSELERLAA